MALTGKQQKFVHEYLKCFNATKAAELAGYKSTNGSLRSIGSENLTKPNISEAIAQHFQASSMSADEALMRIAAIGRGEEINAKPNDILRALELIGKHWSLFVEKVEHSGPGGKPIEFKFKEVIVELDEPVDNSE